MAKKGRTIRTKVYKFNELNETAKEKALRGLYPIKFIKSGRHRDSIDESMDEYKLEFYQDGTLYNSK